jgi:hypothetical protein
MLGSLQIKSKNKLAATLLQFALLAKVKYTKEIWKLEMTGRLANMCNVSYIGRNLKLVSLLSSDDI